MSRAIHVTINHTARDVVVAGGEDIAEVLHHCQIDSLSTAGVDFWFSPTLIAHQRLNTLATDLFLAAGSGFSAAGAPLFYGDVVVASHDSSGTLADFTGEQIERLCAQLGWRREWILGWRSRLARRRARRAVKSGISRRCEGRRRVL